MILGCAQTPSSRIESRPDYFENLSPEQQQKVQSGLIEPGYTKEMVYLSQGEPEEKKFIQKRGKTIEVWSFKGRKPTLVDPAQKTSEGPGFQGAYGSPQWNGGPSRPAPMFYNVKEGFDVEFEKDKVTGVSNR